MVNQIPVNYALFRVITHNGRAQYMSFSTIDIPVDFNPLDWERPKNLRKNFLQCVNSSLSVLRMPHIYGFWQFLVFLVYFYVIPGLWTSKINLMIISWRHFLFSLRKAA